MKQTKIEKEASLNLVPTGLERNFPMVGFIKYISRTRNNPDENFMAERANQINNLALRHYGITASLGIPAIIISMLCSYQ